MHIARMMHYGKAYVIICVRRHMVEDASRKTGASASSDNLQKSLWKMVTSVFGW